MAMEELKFIDVVRNAQKERAALQKQNSFEML
jgi:hypothetical protein